MEPNIPIRISLDVQTEQTAPYKHLNRNKQTQTEWNFILEYSFSQTGQK